MSVPKDPAGVIVDRDGRYEANLAGFCVMYCRIDHAYTLQLELDESIVSVTIASPFTLRRGAEEWRLDPDNRPNDLGPAVQLCRPTHVVEKAEIGEDGSLSLTFEGGDHIYVAPDERFEAWNLAVRKGLVVFACPGGGLASFGPRGGPTE